jgi:hypothetical protein
MSPAIIAERNTTRAQPLFRQRHFSLLRPVAYTISWLRAMTRRKDITTAITQHIYFSSIRWNRI